MGQKTHPIGLRLGIVKTWSSRWYTRKDFGLFIVEDHFIRKYIKKKLEFGSVSAVEIERFANKIKISIFTSRPGIVIGKKGQEIENLRKDLDKLIFKVQKKERVSQEVLNKKREILLEIKEVRKPEMSAQLVAENVAQQLQRRIAFRRAMKKCMSLAFKFGAQGVKIHCSGRLGGAEIARREWYLEGRVPLHTLRADVDYGFAEAKTTYGIIGVKVHIFKGEIIAENSPPRPDGN